MKRPSAFITTTTLATIVLSTVAAAQNPSSKMRVSDFTWKIGGFGNVGLVTVRIENGNDYAVKDIEVHCVFKGKSGTELTDTSRVIYDIVPAKAQHTFKNFNIGVIHSQSARADCWVEGVKQK